MFTIVHLAKPTVFTGYHSPCIINNLQTNSKQKNIKHQKNPGGFPMCNSIRFFFPFGGDYTDRKRRCPLRRVFCRTKAFSGSPGHPRRKHPFTYPDASQGLAGGILCREESAHPLPPCAGGHCVSEIGMGAATENSLRKNRKLRTSGKGNRPTDGKKHHVRPGCGKRGGEKSNQHFHPLPPGFGGQGAAGRLCCRNGSKSSSSSSGGS